MKNHNLHDLHEFDSMKLLPNRHSVYVWLLSTAINCRSSDACGEIIDSVAHRILFYVFFFGPGIPDAAQTKIPRIPHETFSYQIFYFRIQLNASTMMAMRKIENCSFVDDIVPVCRKRPLALKSFAKICESSKSCVDVCDRQIMMMGKLVANEPRIFIYKIVRG